MFDYIYYILYIISRNIISLNFIKNIQKLILSYINYFYFFFLLGRFPKWISAYPDLALLQRLQKQPDYSALFWWLGKQVFFFFFFFSSKNDKKKYFWWLQTNF